MDGGEKYTPSDGWAQSEVKVIMPFGEYSSFADCVKKNQSKKDPEAYCAVIKKKIEGKEEMMSDCVKEMMDKGHTKEEAAKKCKVKHSEKAFIF